jgi:DNA-binding NarL/FixJ family response regulator
MNANVCAVGRADAWPPLNGGNGGPPDAEGPKARILVADGDPLTRKRLCDVLREAGHTVLAEARDGVEAVELAIFYQPDILLTELRLPGADGAEAMRRIHARVPSVRVVFLSTERRSAVQLEVIQAGACGFLSKTTPFDGIIRALQGAMRGEAAVSRDVTRRLVEQLRDIPEAGSGIRPIRSRLTPREWEVLDGLCSGATPRTLAEAMQVQPATVKSYVQQVMAKLGAHSRDEAIELARERFRVRETVI